MKIRTGFYAEQTYLDMIPSLLQQANCKSKNEFMNASLLFYISYLENHLSDRFLSKEIERVIDAKLEMSEIRILKQLKIQSDNTELILKVLLSYLQIDQKSLESLLKEDEKHDI